jgi:guanylate kinase
MKHTQSYKLFIITGLSGAGKTSLADEIVNRFGHKFNLSKIISYTTRAPRKGETDGEDYIFISEYEFEKLATQGQFLETSCYNGNFYATPNINKNTLTKTKNHLVVTDIKGAIALKNLFPNTAKLIFIGVPNLEEAQKRLVLRGLDSAEALEHRYECNLRDLAFFMNHKDRFSLSVSNNEFLEALEIIQDFIQESLE